MKTKFLKRFFSVFAIVLAALVAVGCSINGETSQARENAKQDVNKLLSTDFGETNEDGVVLEAITGNIGIAEDEDGKVSEKDLAENTYSEFVGGITAKYESSNPEVMDAKWVISSVRDYQYAEDGTTVIGITKKDVYTLMFVVNRQEVDTPVTITVTASKFYQDGDHTYKYTKEREIYFTVAAKEKLEAVEMTIAEINAYANANWSDFQANGIVDAQGNKVQVVTTGVVTEVLWGDGYTNHSFVISDGEESFYVYAPKGDTVELGDLVQVICTPTYYYSIIETSKDPQVKVLLNGNEIPAAKEYTVDGWYNAFPDGSSFHDCPGQRVKLEGILQYNGTNYVLESKDGTGKYFEIYYKGYTAYEESLIKANLGKLVKLEAAIYDYHSKGYYRLLANVYDYPMEVLTLDAQSALNADAATIPSEVEVKEGETVELPTTLPNGSVIGKWAADKEGHIDLSTFVASLNGVKENVVVKLTTTVTKGEFSKEVEVTVTIKYVKPTTPEPTEPKLELVETAPEVGVAYKLGLIQGNLENKQLFLNGELSGNFFASTTNPAEAVDVYLEATEGGYYYYFMKGEVKTYICIANDTGYISFSETPSNVWTYNSEYNTMVSAVYNDTFYLGTYNTFETFSKSKISYAATSFVSHFYKYTPGTTEPVEPTHEHVACPTCGLCTDVECDGLDTEKCAGHVSENPGNQVVFDFTLGTSGIESTANAEEAEITMNDIVLGYLQMKASGYDGNNFLMFTKSQTSYMYNKNAFASNIVKIEVVIPSGASASANYHVSLHKEAAAGGILEGGVSYKGNNYTIVLEATDADGFKYFNISSDPSTTKNGQLAKIIITLANGTVVEPTHEHIECPTCGLCTDVECDGLDTEKCQGHLVEEPVVEEKTVAELNAIDSTLEMTASYKVTGTVSAFGKSLTADDADGTKYGNFVLELNGEKIVVYGATATATALTWNAETGKYVFSNPKDFLTDVLTSTIVKGSVVELVVVRTSFNNNPQLNAIVLSVDNSNVVEPTHEHVACPTCGLCTDVECDGLDTEKCAGHEVETPEQENRVDLETLADAHSGSYKTYTSADGWVATNVAYNWGDDDSSKVSNPVFGCLGDSTTRAITLTGKTTAFGSLVSPVLEGGISKLTLNYTGLFSDTKFSVTINVKNEAGEVVATTKLAWTTEDLARYTKGDFVWEIETPVEGKFTLEFVNDCPSASTSNKDRATIWNIEWVGHEAAPVEPEVVATFTFGENVTDSPAHVDGSPLAEGTEYVEGAYTLTLTNLSKVYGPANDATGVSTLKFGTSSAVGTMTFVVPEDVTSVVIYVAMYKAKTTTVDINGVQTTIETSSNDGSYTALTIDTTTIKTIVFSTVSGACRCMVDKIEFVA